MKYQADVNLVLKEKKSTFLETSHSRDSNRSLINSKTAVVNFDKIKESICNTFRGEALLSCDAYLEKGDRIYLFEFKDQPEKNINADEIRKKAFDSLTILLMSKKNAYCQLDLSRQLVLFVVFRYDRDNVFFSKIRGKIASFARVDEPLLFNLGSIEDYYYSEIHTIDENLFLSKYLNKL